MLKHQGLTKINVSLSFDTFIIYYNVIKLSSLYVIYIFDNMFHSLQFVQSKV
jgi:hypothetical protein